MSPGDLDPCIHMCGRCGSCPACCQCYVIPHVIERLRNPSEPIDLHPDDIDTGLGLCIHPRPSLADALPVLASDTPAMQWADAVPETTEPPPRKP